MSQAPIRMKTLSQIQQNKLMSQSTTAFDASSVSSTKSQTTIKNHKEAEQKSKLIQEKIEQARDLII